jgi:hypothetical protein
LSVSQYRSTFTPPHYKAVKADIVTKKSVESVKAVDADADETDETS